MAASNILIHIIALLGFSGLAYALLRVQKQRALILDLLPRKGKKHLHADWQEEYLKKFSAAFAIPLTISTSSAKLPPVALHPELLAKFLFCHGIVAMRFFAEPTAPQGVALAIETNDASGVSVTWNEALSHALKLPTTISVSGQFNG